MDTPQMVLPGMNMTTMTITLQKQITGVQKVEILISLQTLVMAPMDL